MHCEQDDQESSLILHRDDVQIFLIVLCAVLFVYAQSMPAGFDPDTISSAVPVKLVIDPNTADEIELTMLPKVGPSLARRIVQDRQLRGRFSCASDLLRVSGIGPKTLVQLQNNISVNP